jgi:EAL domain-containing protein (putative c-di-GMP-specific phosphodiesterase class I)
MMMIRRRRVEAGAARRAQLHESGAAPRSSPSQSRYWLDGARRDRLVAAVVDRSLEVHAQPIVHLASGAVAGIEALVHLPAPDAERLTAEPRQPDLIASRNLLADVGQLREVVEVYDWYLGRAGQELNQWRADLEPSRALAPLFVSVKLDTSFIRQGAFLSTVKDAVRRAGLTPSQLLLSVDAGQGIEPLWPQLQRLKSHGVRVALEDFRSEAAVTDLVARFPVDVVRLSAKSVVEGVAAGGDDPVAAFAAAVKRAHNLNCLVVAEGVDHPHQADLLERAGCDFAIGCYVSETSQVRSAANSQVRSAANGA